MEFKTQNINKDKKKIKKYMNIIVCVDKDLGMMFNNRRQSRDKILIKHILEFIKSNNLKLYINNFSKDIFNEFLDEYKNQIVIDENFLNKVISNKNNNSNSSMDYCFVENLDISKYQDKIENLIIYDWDKSYPKDKYFTVDLNKFKLITTNEIVGNSHEKILEKIYKG